MLFRATIMCCLIMSCAADLPYENTKSSVKEIDLSVIERGTTAIENGEYEKAYELILPYAQSGNAEAQFTVGLILGWGYGHDKLNPTKQERERKSLYWVRQAAENEHIEAIQLMADAYTNGWYGLPKNEKMSECWRSAIDDPSKASSCMQ